jgi:UDP-N-acetylmuramoyl-tripeptide--D-alanyl-D-alanine ligase
MRELGDETERAHEQLGRVAAGAGLDALLVVGDHAVLVRQGALAAGMDGDRITIAADQAEAAERLRALYRPGDLVLLKASRGAALESVLRDLRGGDDA